MLEPQPAEVAVHIAGAGDQSESMRAKPRDGDVAGDPSAAIEQLGVDDAANRPVNQVARDTFEQTQRSRTVKLDLSE